jgi:hypothetical protein
LNRRKNKSTLQIVKAKPPRQKGITLHPMKVNDALRVMLNTPPMKKRKKRA